MRTWVHENRGSTATPPTKLGQRIAHRLRTIETRAGYFATAFVCAGEDENALKQRLRDFSADDIDKQQIEIQFDSDPAQEHYRLVGTERPGGASDHNGLIESQLTLPDAKALQAITRQQMLQFAATHYVPDGAHLIIAGDFEPKAFMAEVTKAYVRASAEIAL